MCEEQQKEIKNGKRKWIALFVILCICVFLGTFRDVQSFSMGGAIL